MQFRAARECLSPSSRRKSMARNYWNTIRDNERERRGKKGGRGETRNDTEDRGIGGCTSFNCLEATSRRAARHVAPQPILGSDFCGTGFFLLEEQKAGHHADPTATELSWIVSRTDRTIPNFSFQIVPERQKTCQTLEYPSTMRRFIISNHHLDRRFDQQQYHIILHNHDLNTMHPSIYLRFKKKIDITSKSGGGGTSLPL